MACLVLSLCFLLSGCGGWARYYYKLTLSVDTPDGVKTAYNVVEVMWSTWGPDNEFVDPGSHGMALYLDLGGSRRPLIALLSRRLFESISHAPAFPEHWGPWDPTFLLARIYGENRGDDDLLKFISRLGRLRGPREISTEDLPELVTFADVRDPKSIIIVDPDDLESSLGEGIRWHSMTIEVIEDPVVSGIPFKSIDIEQRLPWFKFDDKAFIRTYGVGGRRTYRDFLFKADFKS